MAGPSEEGDALYRTDRVLHRQVRVRYPVIEIDSSILGRDHLLRAYLPPGYYENTLGRDWNVDGSLELLDTMNATACLSSTLSHRDNLIQRVPSEPKNRQTSISTAAGPATTKSPSQWRSRFKAGRPG